MFPSIRFAGVSQNMHGYRFLPKAGKLNIPLAVTQDSVYRFSALLDAASEVILSVDGKDLHYYHRGQAKPKAITTQTQFDQAKDLVEESDIRSDAKKLLKEHFTLLARRKGFKHRP